jgi:hypothetical protein
MNNWKEITDPEELFRLKREGWEIEVGNYLKADWQKWEGTSWYSETPYRASPRQQKMKVQLQAWLGPYTLAYIREGDNALSLLVKNPDWIRQPHLDLEGEVPE